MKEQDMIILSESDSHQIVKFTECGHIGLMYKNLLLSFHPEGFKKFVSAFQEIDFDRHSVIFPDGSNRMVMNTSVSQIQFNFTRREFELLEKAFYEASIVLEMMGILEPDKS